MKNDLLNLIDNIGQVESKFYGVISERGFGMPPGEYIYNVPEFISWKQAILYELQDIYDRTHDTFVWKNINSTAPIHRINGKHCDERRIFNEVKGALTLIKKNIDRYYPAPDCRPEEQKEETKVKKPKIFISHSSKDKEAVSLFTDLLADMGLTNEEMFCSSVPDYAIPLNEDIYDYLASLFNNYDIYVIFMLSDHYYSSPACLNEMGAAWVLKSDYTSILLHGFDYQEIEGAINANRIGLRFDDEDELLKQRLSELIKILLGRFGRSIPDMRWERKRNAFIDEIKKLK